MSLEAFVVGCPIGGHSSAQFLVRGILRRLAGGTKKPASGDAGLSVLSASEEVEPVTRRVTAH